MAVEKARPISEATCVTVGVYTDALTYGKTYVILAWDEDKNQAKVHGDNGCSRWYPGYCFDMTGREVPKLLRIQQRDPSEDPQTCAVEVELELSNGQRRWCFFVTPDILSQLSGEITVGAERLLSYNAPHMIVVSAINYELIEQTLLYIQSQGELLDCTKLIE